MAGEKPCALWAIENSQSDDSFYSGWACSGVALAKTGQPNKTACRSGALIPLIGAGAICQAIALTTADVSRRSF